MLTLNINVAPFIILYPEDDSLNENQLSLRKYDTDHEKILKPTKTQKRVVHNEA